jgi:hypothetical protein
MLQELCFHLIPSLFRPIFISIYPFTIQFECYKCACFQCYSHRLVHTQITGTILQRWLNLNLSAFLFHTWYICLIALEKFFTFSALNLWEIKEAMKSSIEKPGLRHIGQIASSVEGNGQRLADRHETPDINTFKWVRGKGNNFPTQALLLYLSSISFRTSCLIDRVLLIVGLPFVFNNEQHALW